MAETGPWSERQLWGLSLDNANVRLTTLEGKFGLACSENRGSIISALTLPKSLSKTLSFECCRGPSADIVRLDWKRAEKILAC